VQPLLINYTFLNTEKAVEKKIDSDIKFNLAPKAIEPLKK
jgi:hypothetical protein